MKKYVSGGAFCWCFLLSHQNLLRLSSCSTKFLLFVKRPLVFSLLYVMIFLSLSLSINQEWYLHLRWNSHVIHTFSIFAYFYLIISVSKWDLLNYQSIIIDFCLSQCIYVIWWFIWYYIKIGTVVYWSQFTLFHENQLLISSNFVSQWLNTTIIKY